MKYMYDVATVESVARGFGSYVVNAEIDERWVADHPHRGEPYIITISLYGVVVFKMMHPGYADGYKTHCGYGAVVNRTAATVAKAAVGLKAYGSTPARRHAIGSIEALVDELNK